ncbi:Nn.00g009650.m01.CDS01 [Neocucurbitaria sp. VM-36]
MISELFFCALLQVASGLAIERWGRELDTHSAHLQRRELATGSKVAIGICVPAAALVVGLGIGIMWLYPRQLRKLREQNPGAEVGLRELMEGRVTRPAAPQSVKTLPPYEERQGSVTKDVSLESSELPAQPTTNATSRAAPPAAAEARHAPLVN